MRLFIGNNYCYSTFTFVIAFPDLLIKATKNVPLQLNVGKLSHLTTTFIIKIVPVKNFTIQIQKPRMVDFLLKLLCLRGRTNQMRTQKPAGHNNNLLSLWLVFSLDYKSVHSFWGHTVRSYSDYQ